MSAGRKSESLFPDGGKRIKKTKHMKEKKTIDELLYRIARYRSMGNGTMCQMLNSQLRAISAQTKWNEDFPKRRILWEESECRKTSWFDHQTYLK